jgi:hypothetical protein
MRATRLALLLLPLLAPGPALAQGQAESAAIESVISDQLADFNRRDLPGAWEHASPTIQGLFGTPENFGTMVETGYPMVWTNRSAEFLEIEDRGGALHQRVLVRDQGGAGWLLDYEMVEVEGRWLINGVFVQPAPELAA